MPHPRTSRSFAPAMPVAVSLALVFCAPVFISRVLAAEASDTLDLPDARARSAGAAAPAAGVHRLEGEALRRFASLEDALESLPGFRVRRQGGLGGYSELSFRGARAAQVEVYVDGLRLNSDGAGPPDLSGWPLLWFSSLEARTGFSENADPGSIARLDLSTRSTAAAEARARLASFASREAAFSVRAGDKWAWTVGAQGQAARNDFDYFSDNGTQYNTADDAVLPMENNAYRSRGARVSARRETAGQRQTASLLWLDSRKEYPGLFPATALAYGRREEWLAGWRLERFGEAVSWEAGLQGRRYEDAYRDPGQTLGYLSYEGARESWSGEADARARLRLSAFDLGADGRLRTEFTGPTATPWSQSYSSPEARRREAQAGLSLGLRVARFSGKVEGRLSRAHFSADGVRSAPDTGVGRVAALDRAARAARAAAEWRLGAHALGATARFEERSPTSGELLGDNLGVRPHFDVRAEETRGYSLLYAFSHPWGSLGLTGFRNLYRDPIRLNAHGASAFLRYGNGADYRALGLEAEASARARFAEASASLTLQDAEIGEGLYGGNVPAYQSALEARGEFFFKPAAGVRLGPVADYRTGYYPGDANVPDSRRGAEFEWGAHASARRAGVALALDARNLGDRRYRDFTYSPRSGRNYSLTFSLTL